MPKFKNILSAWLKVLKGLTTEEHKRRASICDGCEFKNHSKFLEFKEKGLTEVKGFVCGDCGCPLVAKIRSEEVCKKWL